MAKLLKLRRGTTTQHASFTGAEGEVTIDTTKDTAVVHDGQLAGGRPLARQDMNNVPAGTILGTQLENSGVTAGQYGSSSAIPIVTVDAQGLVTAASTTAIDSTTIANGSSSVSVANNGAITSNANHDFSAGIDVTGNITATGTIGSGNITVTDTDPRISLVDSNNNSDFSIFGNGGSFTIADDTNVANRLTIDSNGTTTIAQNLDVGAGVDVTGNITVTGTVDGVDVAARDTLFGGLTSSSGVLTNGVTATTQAASDNSTKVATTAYVTTGIANAQAFPSGTKMLFQQTAAPTGWTKVTSGVDNKALRVVSGTAGSGGSNAFSNTLASRSITANAGNTTATGNISVANATQGGNVSVSIANASTGGTVNNHTLSTSQMPSHSHTVTGGNYGGGVNRPAVTTYYSQTSANTGSTGGGGAHNHGFTGGSHNHNANASFSGSAHTHNATFTGAAHNHSISVTNLDLAVQYLDVIIASKD
tara:strand:- start:1181 stop:2611 length:1431 start_codon:yes stop_codon:yes gene_type:complete